ncbi:Chromosome III, complete sequence, related [Eimeria necatrix]|uniref:Chromosome III, complete sequence, related n=1 Tax=Eimeria necatrix TaxID=51315 RepID=U6MRV4_9EIME|nr:Chromosome III, complete sequence, related [Eimeria necatrix]CDJ66736.1 Chromosome III, complete sequence, related [Eimeria necatrix]
MAEPQSQCQELQRPPQQEACCWRFEPVTVLGNQGVVVLTAKRFLFASKKSSSNSSCSNGGEEKDGSGNKVFWEVLLQFPLVCWTSTERSKKAAKARISYVAPTAAAAAAPTATVAINADGVSLAQSVVVDFMGVRDKMDLCCRSLQTLASAARTVQSSSNLACPLEVPLLLQLLQLPPNAVLRVAPALLQQQELLKQRLQEKKQQEAEQDDQQRIPEDMTDGRAPARKEAAAAKHSLGGAQQSSARDKGTVNAAAAAGSRPSAASASMASATSAPVASAIEPPNLEKLLQKQRQQEAEQLQQLQQQLLQQDPEMRELYQTLVGPPEGLPSGNSQKGLSPSEFWKLHEQHLQALKPQPAPEGVSASFLSRPPHYHLEGQQAGQGGGASAELVVDCSEQMLKQILEEDTTIRLAYEALVSTGRMTAERFWGRVFRSRYFQSGIGLPERQKEMDDEEASALIASFLKETLVSSRDALSLPGVDRTLLSDADLRVRGFGLPDGLSSLAGDLAEKPIPMGGASAPASAVAAVGSGSLVGRFNKHSQRLLLQQLLQPAAAAAVTGDKAGYQEKLQLLVQQDELLRRQRGVTTGTGVPAADPKDAATIGCGVLEEEAPLLASLRLEELEDAVPAKHQTLEVSRRQLYAAGARVWRSSPSRSFETSARPPTTAGIPLHSLAKSDRAAEGAAIEKGTRCLQVAQEVAAAEAWLWMQREKAKDRNKGARQTAEEVAAVYETGRYMFVFNTKLCQKDKAAQVATLDYEAATVNAVRAQQARVGELLRHFYNTTLPEDKKRIRLIQALDSIKAELENSQDISGGFTGAATKALSAPIVEQINAARRHAHRLQRLLQAAREKRATQQSRQAGQQHHHHHQQPVP